MTEPTDETVGFTAYCETSVTYYSNDIVVFGAVESNVGEYYQTSSSQFICPVDGLYAFSLNILTVYGEYFSGKIMREALTLVTVDADPIDVNNGVSNFVVSVCNKGERVWVSCYNSISGLFGNGNRYTTFSGYLINRL